MIIAKFFRAATLVLMIALTLPRFSPEFGDDL
jgi:hypothetical protein